MSHLQKAKNEVQNLLNLAKIEVSSTREAKLKIAEIHGFDNWHTYALYLKEKDILCGTIDKNTKSKSLHSVDKSYYLQDIALQPFTGIKNSVKTHTRIDANVSIEHKDGKFLIKEYPLYILGHHYYITHMIKNYIDSGEGFIFFEAHGRIDRFADLYKFAKSVGRDMCAISLCQKSDSTTSIDPLNPMVDCDKYFKKYFGVLGPVIQAVMRSMHQNNQLMDVSNLESLLMLSTLRTIPEAKDYLSGMTLEKHHRLAHTAYRTVSIFKNYEHLFKLDCNIDIEQIFLQQKLFYVLTNYNVPDLNFAAELILAQVAYFDDKLQLGQNIILDEYAHYAEASQYIKNSNLIFNSRTAEEDSAQIMNYALLNSKAFMLARTNELLPPSLKLRIFDMLQKGEDFELIAGIPTQGIADFVMLGSHGITKISPQYHTPAKVDFYLLDKTNVYSKLTRCYP